MDLLNRPQPPSVPSSLAINDLRSHCAKLDQIIFRLRDRDRALIGMCSAAVKRSDTPRARIYANEIVRVRMLLKAMGQSQLAIECIAIRLENFLELHNLVEELKPLSKIIQEVTNQVSRVMPEIATDMEQLYGLVSETLTETSVDFTQPNLDLAANAGSLESEEILKEISMLVEKKLKDDLPEPPSLAVAIPATEFSSEMVIESIPMNFTQSKTSEGITLANCSQEVNVLPDDILQMLDELNRRTRAKLEACTT